ncbi:MAG: hypothetical protein ACJ8EY_03575 [Sphingomicrobium sp.]
MMSAGQAAFCGGCGTRFPAVSPFLWGVKQQDAKRDRSRTFMLAGFAVLLTLVAVLIAN